MDETLDKLQKVGYQVVGADNHVKSRDSRISQTPTTDVKWSGERGASRCYPTDKETQKYLRKYGREYVSYDLSGEPNFSPFETMHVRISNMSSNRQQNFSNAGKRALQTDWAKNNNIHTLSELDAYMAKHQLTWHECSDGVTLRMVPTRVNARFGHSGGVSETGAMDSPNDFLGNGLLRTFGSEQGKAKIRVNKKIVKAEEQIDQFGREITGEVQKVVSKTSDAIEQAGDVIASGVTPVVGNSVEALKNNKVIAGVASKVEQTADIAGQLGNTFVEGAAETLASSAIPLLVSGVQNICQVATGEKTMEEAVEDMSKMAGTIAVTGGFTKAVPELVTMTANKLAQQESTKALAQTMNKLSQSAPEIAQIISAGILVKDSFCKVINGEISGEEFFCEVGEKGVLLVSNALGSIVGAGIGQIFGGPLGAQIGQYIGAAIMTTVCVGVYDYTVNFVRNIANAGKNYERKLAAANQIADKAIQEIKRQQEGLREMMDSQYSEWSKRFQLGFDMIADSIIENNFEQMSCGLECILEVFGESIKFKTMEEFDDFFFDDNAVLTL